MVALQSRLRRQMYRVPHLAVGGQPFTEHGDAKPEASHQRLILTSMVRCGIRMPVYKLPVKSYFSFVADEFYKINFIDLTVIVLWENTKKYYYRS